MVKIKKFVFNDFQESTFLLYDETNECIVIDCGCFYEDEKQSLEAFVYNNNLKLVGAYSTHCHIDHILGNGFLKEKYGLKYFAAAEDKFLIESAVNHAAAYGFEVTQPPFPDHFIKEGDIVKFGNSELEIFSVPGHSPGSLVYYSKQEKILIVGDVLFAGSIGRTDLPGGDMDALLSAIRKKLFVLPGETRVFPGHGPETTIEIEKTTNPFFRF